MSTWMDGKDLMKLDYQKKIIYSNLTMECIIDVDYKHVKRVREDFVLQNLGQYQDLYWQRNTLLLADVLENFRNKGLNIYY